MTPNTPTPDSPRPRGVIAVVNVKGGVGKTTVSVHLAAALHELGVPVSLWDADPQGSATQWLDAAAQTAPVPIPYSPVNLDALRSTPAPADVLVIDTPPGLMDVQRAVLARSQFVIVPTQQGGADLTQALRTAAALEAAGMPHAVLVNRAAKPTISHREASTEMDAAEAAVLETSIPQRESIRRAWNHWPTLTEPWRTLATEMTELMTR
ncbi:ParA family protein [Micrococcus sp. M4NT]|uniref:ParA family protein n=1 Tax=Micrococcus sp. M4NT TaxID=2957501 RepID=UPI0029AFC043|nr:ParA family protein [Micrococcus sp. M4NT]MDX2342191.1 ParA family protein [Micrococcus sp. M4NT]